MSDQPRGVRDRARALPLRLRLVAGFAVAISVVLIAAGAFVYWRVAYALDLRLNNDVRDNAVTLKPLVTPAGVLRSDPGVASTPAGRLYQVFDAQGHVLAFGPELGTVPVLPFEQLRAALTGPVRRDVGSFLPRSSRPLRVLAVPLPGAGPAKLLVVAVRRDQRDEALRELLGQLTLAALGALLVSAVVGERLAKAALVPVERYRTQAASIAAGASGVRLDVPAERNDEVTRLGHSLNAMLDALEQTVEREKRFTQDASHELRTPLTLLSTRVQLALRRPRSAEQQEATLRELGRDIDSLSNLADNLLALTAAGNGPAPGNGVLALSLPDLGELVAAVVAEHEDAELGTIALTNEASVPIGPQQLRQVLANLLGNASAHGAPPICLRAMTAGQVVRITVTDHGPGMPPEFLPRATERFARADEARDRPGAGLGLSLVHALLEPTGGELRLCVAGVHQRFSHTLELACEHPPSGTTATVLLPLNPCGVVPRAT